MKRFISTFKDMVSVMIILGFAFCAGCLFGANNKHHAIMKEKNNFDLELPLEVEKRVVTVEEVEAKLNEIGELSTYQGEYSYTLGESEERYWLEKVPVWGSENYIEITCNGIVKVGYDVDEIGVNVNGNTIYISIPEAKLHDNYVIWDSIECSERNNILNPIEFEQYQEMISKIEKDGLQEVVKQGIYKKAEENLKKIIDIFMGEFDNCEVVYM